MAEKIGPNHIDPIPGRSPLEKLDWITTVKSEYSKPREKRTAEQLEQEFPLGTWQNDPYTDGFSSRPALFTNRGGRVFITEALTKDGENAKRIFNEEGYEIERYKYKRINKDGSPNVFDIYWRTMSEHDEDGYLVRHLHLELFSSYFNIATYTTLPDGTKEISGITTQAVIRQPDTSPGPLYGNPTTINFASAQKALEEKVTTNNTEQNPNSPTSLPIEALS